MNADTSEMKLISGNAIPAEDTPKTAEKSEAGDNDIPGKNPKMRM